MPRILLIEPPGERPSALEQILRRPGWVVDQAADGRSVEEKLARQLPDLVVLDLTVDNARGLEICRLIRSTGGADLLPVLMVGTGNEGVRNFGDALVEGGDYYFEKPVDAAKLIAKIGAYVGGLSEEPTLVSAPPPATVGQRVERMLDLGAAFRGGLLAPEATPLEEEPTVRNKPPTSGEPPSPPSKGEGVPHKASGPTRPEKVEDLETIMSQLAVELAEMSDGSADALAIEAKAWSKLQDETRREAEEKARREAEEKARREAEEEARRQAERRARREAEAERLRQQIIQQARLKAETLHYRTTDRLLRLEIRQRVILAEQQKANLKPGRGVFKPEAGEEKKPRSPQRPVGIDEGLLQEEVLEAEQIWAEAAEDALQNQEPAKTRGGGDRLIRLLEREASLARELSSLDEAQATAEDGISTAPHLPPRPGEEAPAAVSPSVVQYAKEEQDEFEKEKTEDLFPRERRLTGYAADEPEPVTRGRTVGRVRRIRSVFEKDQWREGSEEEAVATESVFIEPPRPRPLPPDPLESNLESENAARIFWRFYLQKITGAVRFQSGADVKTVFFEAGVPVGVHSNQNADRLEEMLLRESLIDRAAYAEARLKGLLQPRALAAHLVERGILRAEELFPLVRRHFSECLIGLFEWQEGSLSWSPGYAPDGEKVQLNRPVPWLVCEGIRRKFSLERMMRELGSPASLLAPAPEGQRVVKVEELGLLAAERKVLSLVNGNRPLEEIIFLSGQSEELVYRTLLAAEVMGLLLVTARGLRGGAEDPEEQLRSSLAIARRRLEAKFEQINRVSYFELLGLAPSATAYEVDLAYRKMMSEFHPANYTHPQLADLAEKLQAVRISLEDAREVLSDDLLREGYRRALAEK